MIRRDGRPRLACRSAAGTATAAATRSRRAASLTSAMEPTPYEAHETRCIRCERAHRRHERAPAPRRRPPPGRVPGHETRQLSRPSTTSPCAIGPADPRPRRRVELGRDDDRPTRCSGSRRPWPDGQVRRRGDPRGRPRPQAAAAERLASRWCPGPLRLAQTPCRERSAGRSPRRCTSHGSPRSRRSRERAIRS